MKTSDLINIIKKYIDDEVRLIIRSEIKLAFKELAASGINPSQTIKHIKSQAGTQPQIKSSFKENTITKKIIKQQPPIKPPIKTGNSIIDNILIETKIDMINNPIQDEGPEVSENIINSLMVGKNIPMEKPISMTMGNTEISNNDMFMGQIVEEQNQELQLENMESIPSVDDFINMKRE
ncbi:hypothetical protein M0P65_06475 [Candidatus Gracilibacteria bacterium]|jgi:hypothetical protein|nr:hypothetical protein [Candidatus Gracilibacteria bacterium]